MSQILELEYLAMILNIDLKKEPNLIPLLQQMVILPTGWVLTPEKTFLEVSSGKKHQHHPAREILLQIIDSRRIELLEVCDEPSLQTTRGRTSWLELELPPEVLVFHTWFNEGSTTRSTLIRRELKLEYHFQTQCFHVHIQGCDQIYQISHILNKAGQPLDHRDLYVGAVLDILGKNTTLMQANLLTSQWIESQARYLDKLTENISSEMRKYSLKAPGSSVVANPVVFRSSANPASFNLRKMMKKLEALYLDFEELRPEAAASWSKLALKIGRNTAKIADVHSNTN